MVVDKQSFPEDQASEQQELEISVPGLSLNLQKTHSQQPQISTGATKELTSLRGSVSIKKGDFNNMSIDGLNPKIGASMNGVTINRLTMRLPIFKIMQA